ncbi:MAG: Bax inhibitor-1/YccA family protein [Spirochaetia bacterium]|nr:Bax inhibitor-1/YccA family protein [Spirochaetia bacterium]
MAQIRHDFLVDPVARERNILRNVYLWMTAGLFLTGIVSYAASQSDSFLRLLYGTPGAFLVLMVAELALVIYLSSRIQKMSAQTAVFAFIGYAFLNGLTLSVIFLAYTGLTITQAFFTTAAAFGGMSLYGLSTKKDLSGAGHYLLMGLWGIIIASVINFFIGSSALYYGISFIGVAVFMGLTAWDTQVIKRWNDAYGSAMDEEQYVKLSIMGALKLYLDFINMFLFLLRIFGRRR